MNHKGSVTWRIRLRVFRGNRNVGKTRFDVYEIEIAPERTVLDALEKIWAFQDRSLAFRHACHHASCGSCGIRVNGLEKLTCVAPLHEVTRDGGTLTCEPLRGFPLVADLVVDMGDFFSRLEDTGFEIIRSAEPLPDARDHQHTRFENCIECGLCVSACPISATDMLYLGPAALAASWRMTEEPRGSNIKQVLANVDQEHGCWRCHAAFECSEACPSNVDPGAMIMSLRKYLLKRKLRGLIGRISDA
jgi:succinate dehydrogenase / fumarate reductase iron-sulfur subunit